MWASYRCAVSYGWPVDCHRWSFYCKWSSGVAGQRLSHWWRPTHHPMSLTLAWWMLRRPPMQPPQYVYSVDMDRQRPPPQPYSISHNWCCPVWNWWQSHRSADSSGRNSVVCHSLWPNPWCLCGVYFKWPIIPVVHHETIATTKEAKEKKERKKENRELDFVLVWHWHLASYYYRRAIQQPNARNSMSMRAS